jgi:hypothetical protein
MGLFGKKKNKEAEPSGGPFVSFVLLDTSVWSKDDITRHLWEDWNIDARDTDGESSEDVIFFEIDGMIASVSLMPAPVPDGEAEYNAATNYMWPQAVQETKKHVAHLLVAVLPGMQKKDADLLEAGMLLVKLNAACLKSGNAIGVYTSGTVYPPDYYTSFAEVMKDDELPYENWIYFGLRSTESGKMNGYTYGLEAFGKEEIEVLESTAEPMELREFLFNIAAYILDYDVTLNDGETIGFSEDEKLLITRSKGENLGGMTLKIGYLTA